MAESRPERKTPTRKQRRPARHPAAPAHAPARTVVTPANAARLPAHLSRRDQAALVVIAAAGIAVFADLPNKFDTYGRHPLYAIIVTVVLLAAVFTIERRALVLTAQSSVRFSVVGIVSPVMWYIVPLGALTPICALQGLTTWRLGVGSVFPPAVVATLATSLYFGPWNGMLVAVGHVWPGVAALLLTRRREGR